MFSLKKAIHFPVFLISLAVGLLFVYLTESPKQVVYIYPTPDNVDKFSYRDAADNCFMYESNKVKCPSDERDITRIPMQSETRNEAKSLF
jgi:hypothetical protein